MRSNPYNGVIRFNRDVKLDINVDNMVMGLINIVVHRSISLLLNDVIISIGNANTGGNMLHIIPREGSSDYTLSEIGAIYDAV